jgi:hypothetical protein
MGISLKPQQTKSSKGVWWYYENKGSIDVLVDAEKTGVVSIRIPASMLRKSIERMDSAKKGAK